MLDYEADGMVEIGVGGLALFQRAAPEPAFLGRAAAQCQPDRHRDLTLAKVVPDVLAELLRLAAIVERIVHQLEGDTEVHPERTACSLLGLRAPGEHRADLTSGGEQLCGL